MDIAIAAAFIIYFLTLTGIGYYFYHTTHTEKDFLLANRSVNYWVTAIATQASDMSSWLFLGFPAAVYMHGVFELWTAIGLVAGMFLTWHYIAPQLRTATEQSGSITLTSFLSYRFPTYRTAISCTLSAMAILFLTFYIAASLIGLGRLFSAALDISYTTGTLFGLLFAVLYTLLGGFVAIAWCDLFQGIFLLLMIILVPACAYNAVGGWSPIIAALKEQEVPLSLIGSWRDTLHSIVLAAGWGLGYFGQPHILTNFMAIDTPENIKYAKRVGIAWQSTVLLAASSIGLIGVAYTNGIIADPENLFVIMARGLLPSFLAGCALCGILAATLSTLDSHILIAGSILAQDVYKKTLSKKASDRTIVFLSRVASIIVSLIGLGIAHYSTTSLYTLTNYAWAGLGASFGPLVILSLYAPRYLSGKGALAGIISGGTIAAVWPYYNVTILPLAPAFFGSLCILLLVSNRSRGFKKK